MCRDKSEHPLTYTVQVWVGLQRAIQNNLEILEIFFAPTKLADEKRKHVEVCIARQLRLQHPEAVRFYPADNRTIPRKMRGSRIAVTAEVPIEGLDPQIEV